MGMKTNTFKRMLSAVGSLFSSKASKQIPSPPTGAKADRVIHIGKSGYRCSLFPGTHEKNKVKRRKARKVAHRSRMVNAMVG